MENINEQKRISVESILAKLTPEEKMVFEQVQKSTEAKAKKKAVQRRLDDADRKSLRDCLDKVGCNDKKIALNDARTLALRWVLANHFEVFGKYIKELHGVAAIVETEVNKPSAFIQPRQNVQQGTYKYPVEHGNK